MKKIATAIAISAIALAFVPASADGRTVTGTIVAPSAKVPAVGEEADPVVVTRHARCAYLLAGADSNGVLGHVVDISEGEWGSSFSLTSDAGDPDIVFFADLGTCDNAPAPTPLDDTLYVGDGPESGTVPDDATAAIIVTAGAANSTFTLTIG